MLEPPQGRAAIIPSLSAFGKRSPFRRLGYTLATNNADERCSVPPTFGTVTIPARVLGLKPYRPGKPIEEVQRELGLRDIVKLASNENSLGPSPLAVEAIHRCAAEIHRYPDAGCLELRAALANRLGVSTAMLALGFGHGSNELIHAIGQTLLEPGHSVVSCRPTFSRYEAAAVVAGAEYRSAQMVDWTYDAGALIDAIDRTTRVVFLANPNSPTGAPVSSDLAESVIESMPPDCVLVLDEAYHEYVESPHAADSIELARTGAPVIALRTFSKAYGLAGLRLGYAVGPAEIIDAVSRVPEPFGANLLALAGAVAALGDCGHVERTLAMNRAGKRMFYQAFTEMGLSFTATEANFVWVDVGRPSDQVFSALLERGVIVREGSAFGGPTHLRVTIGTGAENERFLNALREVLA